MNVIPNTFLAKVSGGIVNMGPHFDQKTGDIVWTTGGCTDKKSHKISQDDPRYPTVSGWLNDSNGFVICDESDCYLIQI